MTKILHATAERSSMGTSLTVSMLQLRVCMPQLMNPRAATKTEGPMCPQLRSGAQHSQRGTVNRNGFCVFAGTDMTLHVRAAEPFPLTSAVLLSMHRLPVLSADKAISRKMELVTDCFFKMLFYSIHNNLCRNAQKRNKHRFFRTLLWWSFN